VLWAFIIVKVSRAKVITIEPSADALSVGESLTLYGFRFRVMRAVEVATAIIAIELPVSGYVVTGIFSLES